MTFIDAQASFKAQSRTLARARRDLVDGFRRHEL
ncbi:ABC transporter permease, partial [Mycobacterium kansasii]